MTFGGIQKENLKNTTLFFKTLTGLQFNMVHLKMGGPESHRFRTWKPSFSQAASSGGVTGKNSEQ